MRKERGVGDMRSGRTTAVVAGLAIAVMALAGCGGSSSDSGDSWPGQAVPYSATGQDFHVGTWAGQPGMITVSCSGDKSDPTMTIKSPKGDKVTVVPAAKGAKVTVTPKGGESQSYTSQVVAHTSGTVDFTDNTELKHDVPALDGQYTCEGGDGSS